MLRPSRAFPSGEPYLCGRCPTGPYKCFRCGSTMHLDAARYNQLRPLTLEDYADLAKQYKAPQLKELPLKDFGGYLQPEHAKQCFEAGFRTRNELEALERTE